MRTAIRTTPLLLILGLIHTSNARTQDSLDISFGEGIPVYAKDSSFALKFSTRIQSRYQARTGLDGDYQRADINSAFLIRRARLKFSGFAYHPDLRFKIELGQSNSDLDGISRHTSNAPNIVYDAVLKWRIRDNLDLWAGQTKLPGNRERVISSQELQFVDRSRVNANFNIDRDIGFQLRHHFSIGKVLVRDIISVSQGEGRNVVTGAHNGYNYTGRIELLPFGPFEKGGDYVGAAIFRQESPKLSIGADYDYNRNAMREEGQTGDFLPFQRDLQTLHFDMMFKYQGLSVMAEYGQRQASHPVLYDATNDRRLGSFYTGQGWVAQTGYLFKNDLEISARYTSIMPEKAVPYPDVSEYTLGLSRYIVGHALKVQSDISYIERSDREDDGLRFRLQTELSF